MITEDAGVCKRMYGSKRVFVSKCTVVNERLSEDEQVGSGRLSD